LKTSNKFGHYVIEGYGVTRDPNNNEYLLVLDYDKNGDLHNNLSKNFKEIAWKNKMDSLFYISDGWVSIFYSLNLVNIVHF